MDVGHLNVDIYWVVLLESTSEWQTEFCSEAVTYLFD
jgi:hypothetical protein